jgi:hypothetical protein
MSTQENWVNYDDNGEQSEIYLQRRIDRIMAMKVKRMNFVYTVE